MASTWGPVTGLYTVVRGDPLAWDVRARRELVSNPVGYGHDHIRLQIGVSQERGWYAVAVATGANCVGCKPALLEHRDGSVDPGKAARPDGDHPQGRGARQKSVWTSRPTVSLEARQAAQLGGHPASKQHQARRGVRDHGTHSSSQRRSPRNQQIHRVAALRHLLRGSQRRSLDSTAAQTSQQEGDAPLSECRPSSRCW
jgi:hypothetical protein